jgi:uncharacterized membrane protein
MKSKFFWSFVFSLFVLLTSSLTVAQDKVDFVKQIKPILEKHCMECHNADGGEYPIESKDDAFDYIVEGSPEDSEMFDVLVTDDEDYLMPPADFERPLTDEQIGLVKRWIAEGAQWPDDVTFTMWKPEVSQEDGAGGSADSEESAKSDATENQDAEVAAIDPRIFGAIGSLHPAVLHLPMGLLLGAGFFALLSLRGNFVMSDCAYYCLWLGVLTSILACATGWYFSETKSTGSVAEFNDLFNQDHKVFWHRTSALVSTAFGLLLALFAMSARSRDPDEGAAWKLGAIVLAAGIGYVGMTGGKLVYPSNHYKDINSLWSDLMDAGEEAEPAAEGGEAKPEAKPEADPKMDSEMDDNAQDGETSEVI